MEIQVDKKKLILELSKLDVEENSVLIVKSSDNSSDNVLAIIARRLRQIIGGLFHEILVLPKGLHPGLMSLKQMNAVGWYSKKQLDEEVKKRVEEIKSGRKCKECEKVVLPDINWEESIKKERVREKFIAKPIWKYIQAQNIRWSHDSNG